MAKRFANLELVDDPGILIEQSRNGSRNGNGGKRGTGVDQARVEGAVREILLGLGEDPDREGLLATPRRVASSLAFLTSGYRSEPEAVINDAVFEVEANNMIIARDIEVYSMCEHHMLPFFGRCHIGYIAKKKILGVSKLARIAEHFARRLQIQERLTAQNALDIFGDYDIIIDGSDNFPTKYLVNDACFFAGKPYVYGGVFQFEGQASVFFPKDGGPCLRCLFPEPPPPGLVPS